MIKAGSVKEGQRHRNILCQWLLPPVLGAHVILIDQVLPHGSAIGAGSGSNL